MSVRVLVAGDHAIVRHSLSRSIQQEQDMEVVGQAGTGLAALDLVRQRMPNVILMDISMPDMNGMEATRLILRESPQTRVIDLSVHAATRLISESCIEPPIRLA